MNKIQQVLKNTTQPQLFLLVMAFIMPFVFQVWMTLLNNFVVEKAAFTGAEIGMLQSIREIPGFLAFTAIYILIVIKEQKFAILSLGLLSIGVALTGYFPSVYGLFITTFIMSVGFHYYETIQQSLTLQWLDKKQTAHFMGKQLAVKSFASILAFAGIWVLMEQFTVSYQTTYLIAGVLGFIVVLWMAWHFPHFEQPHVQHKKFLLRKRYWLYYLLTFLSGARRQIFVVFAGFMMVEQFGYSVGEISILFGVNYIFNLFFAAQIGKWVGKIGERKALTFEYVGLIFVFTGYAFVENAEIAAGLYIIDHMFFALAIAIKTYFQKIADHKDIAATASVSFTINHIAAVIIPVLLGFVWLYSHTLVFFVGTGFAVLSLIGSRLIPDNPSQEEYIRGRG
ncbi:MFS transporter [Psychrosphaera aquimarina]|uniref:MFS transporter n=1 Tax=Psychrosphaera aquimarina TaxID=2044854 RepID=A0ABU3R3V5_9GAMM|nr:MFS transporter [Psychrosphaera aquimarina]MDU0114125.1 MFS transporter [Psychrosphaera aquimarina]